MNLKELSRKLNKKGVPEDAYSLLGGLPNEKFCIVKKDQWEVYYSEKGIKSSLRIFSSEDEACRFFYSWVVKIVKSMGLI